MKDSFDYGEKKEDGQYANHPTIDEGEFETPIRMHYIHDECGKTTQMNKKLAESWARDPFYYDLTFCVHCGDYFDVSEFVWEEESDKRLGEK